MKENKLKKSNFKKNDPLGSYTGVCEEKYEEPVQDADDLWIFSLDWYR